MHSEYSHSNEGLHLPDSVPVAWHVNAERLVVLGWGRAVLMQLAHPLIAAGVGDHSSFRQSTVERMRRFQRTLGAMLVLTYGDEDEARRMAEHINGIHDRVHGRLQESAGVVSAGARYSARDPGLLAWVHATMLDSSIKVYEACISPLTLADKDRYCAEATTIGPLLGIPDDSLPKSIAELDAYVSSMLASGEIAVGTTARRLARDLLGRSLGFGGWLELPMRLPYQLVTVGLLPPEMRRAYGLPWSPAHEAAFKVTVRSFKLARSVMPDSLCHWPEAASAIHRANRAA